MKRRQAEWSADSGDGGMHRSRYNGASGVVELYIKRQAEYSAESGVGVCKWRVHRSRYKKVFVRVKDLCIERFVK